MKRLVSLLLCLLLLTGCAPALAATTKTASQIHPSFIPWDQLPEPVDGQHHYLLLCVDQWNKPMGNTDGMVILTLDTRGHRIMLTSIIRDAIVCRPDGVPGRITYIASNYGVEALMKVISEHLGVRLEKYILFNFSQIRDIVDYFGGVDITINDAEAHYFYINEVRPRPGEAVIRAAGTYHFGGRAAITYMRMRKADGHGDFMRTQRVRNVLSTLADRCRVMTWDEALGLVNAILESSSSTNMTLQEMQDAAGYAFGLRDCVIEELRIPPSDDMRTAITYAGMSVQEIDWEACREAMADYLQNSFLVLSDDGGESLEHLDELEDDFGDLETIFDE